MRHFVKIALLTGVILAAILSSRAIALTAYIDVQSGIIVGRGEAYMSAGDNYSTVRDVAVKRGKTNIYNVLERQPVDLTSMEQRTIGEYLRKYPDREKILNAFIDSAKIFKEAQDEKGNLEVTLILPVEGPDGYKIMLAKLMGKVVPARNLSGTSGEIDEEIREELQKHLAGRTPDEIGQPYEIAMLDFTNDTNFQGVDIGSIFSEKLEDRFLRDRRFVFLSHTESLEVLGEYGYDEDAVWDADISMLMRFDEIDGLVVGALTRYEPKFKKHGIGSTGYLETAVDIEVDLRILSARTGRWVFYKKIPVRLTERTFTLGSANDADQFIKLDDLDDEDGLAARTFAETIDKVEEVIRSVFPIEGYVLKVIGSRIYTNLTSTDGIRKGDVLDVFRIGDMLQDPVTGQDIDRIRDRLGSIRVTEVKATYSQTVSVDIASEPINAGDIVTIHYE